MQRREAVVLAVELDDVPGTEYIVSPAINRFVGIAFKSNVEGSWIRIGNYRSVMSERDFDAFDAAVASGDFKSASPEYADVMIGEHRYYPAP